VRAGVWGRNVAAGHAYGAPASLTADYQYEHPLTRQHLAPGVPARIVLTDSRQPGRVIGLDYYQHLLEGNKTQLYYLAGLLEDSQIELNFELLPNRLRLVNIQVAENLRQSGIAGSITQWLAQVAHRLYPDESEPFEIHLVNNPVMLRLAEQVMQPATIRVYSVFDDQWHLLREPGFDLYQSFGPLEKGVARIVLRKEAEGYQVLEKPEAVEVRLNGAKVEIRDTVNGKLEQDYKFKTSFDITGKLKSLPVREKGANQAFTDCKPQNRGKQPIINIGLLAALAGLAWDLVMGVAGGNMHLGVGTGVSVLLLVYFTYRLPQVLGYFRQARAFYTVEDLRLDLQRLHDMTQSLPLPQEWLPWINGQSGRVPESVLNIGFKSLKISPWRLLLFPGRSSYYDPKTNELALHKNIKSLSDINRLRVVAHELKHLLDARRTSTEKAWWQRMGILRWLAEEITAFRLEIRLRAAARSGEKARPQVSAGYTVLTKIGLNQVQLPVNAGVLAGRRHWWQRWPGVRLALINFFWFRSGRSGSAGLQSSSTPAQSGIFATELGRRLLGQLPPHYFALSDLVRAQKEGKIIEIRIWPEDIGKAEYLRRLSRGECWQNLSRGQEAAFALYLPADVAAGMQSSWETTGRVDGKAGRLFDAIAAYAGDSHYQNLYRNAKQAKRLQQFVDATPSLEEHFSQAGKKAVNWRLALEQLALANTENTLSHIIGMVLREWVVAQDAQLESGLLQLLRKIDPGNNRMVKIVRGTNTFYLRVPALVLEKQGLLWLLQKKYPDSTITLDNKKSFRLQPPWRVSFRQAA
ncbi:hypothetical protein JW933_05945, partial [candidate division FCPU426 bacterium]|nr:hypothetical protein [candidate division FCPU426 bacterium]